MLKTDRLINRHPKKNTADFLWKVQAGSDRLIIKYDPSSADLLIRLENKTGTRQGDFKYAWKSPRFIAPLKIEHINGVVAFSYFSKGKRHVKRFRIRYLLKKLEQRKGKKQNPIHTNVLMRVPQNPILAPKNLNRWESSAVFNTAALRLGNKTHFIYRAIGESGLSVFGYANSNDGVNIDERMMEPAYVTEKPVQSTEKKVKPYPYLSGGSWWGCEDPRLTHIGDTLYMTYTAFDGCRPPCVALTSIPVENFLRKEWNWKKPLLISEPGAVNKNWVVFPEKINGKFAILHSITPQIQIDYYDTLDFGDGGFIRSYYKSKGRDEFWDNWVRGVGPPPVKTKYGWLLLYHAMDKNDPDKYKIGAMLLDEKNPEKILYRSNSPLLQPEEWYENEGHKSGVVYACGATLQNEKLFVYYGGADSYVCATVANINDLMDHLKENPPGMNTFSSIRYGNI